MYEHRQLLSVGFLLVLEIYKPRVIKYPGANQIPELHNWQSLGLAWLLLGHWNSYVILKQLRLPLWSPFPLHLYVSHHANICQALLGYKGDISVIGILSKSLLQFKYWFFLGTKAWYYTIFLLHRMKNYFKNMLYTIRNYLLSLFTSAWGVKRFYERMA